MSPRLEATGTPEPSDASRALDPASDQTSVVRDVEAWLGLQSALAYEPEIAILALARDPSPAGALAAAGKLPLFDASVRRAQRLALARLGARLLPLPSASYPTALRSLIDPPPVLIARGDIDALYGPAVAIVGARAATVYGLETARTLASALAAIGIVVVSGLARGIDAAAPRGALEAGGRTVAVQACGADRVYPPEHRSLADEIAESGAVVTELPLGAAPRAPHFPLRNRLISGLCCATVIVEARERSGSLVTAGHALNQGREVFAVPGAVHAATSWGPNTLLRDGARPLLDVRDLFDVLPPAFLQQQAERLGAEKRGGEVARPPSDDCSRALRERLGGAPMDRDALCRALPWPSAMVTGRLVELELGGWVREDRDGRLCWVGERNWAR
jgi:DNA processing protein